MRHREPVGAIHDDRPPSGAAIIAGDNETRRIATANPPDGRGERGPVDPLADLGARACGRPRALRLLADAARDLAVHQEGGPGDLPRGDADDSAAANRLS